MLVRAYATKAGRHGFKSRSGVRRLENLYLPPAQPRLDGKWMEKVHCAAIDFPPMRHSLQKPYDALYRLLRLKCSATLALAFQSLHSNAMSQKKSTLIIKCSVLTMEEPYAR